MAYTAIDDPEAYFQAVIYTGNGSANHAITLPGDTDMQPDFVWIKNRDAADSHCLFDAVRGATKLLSSDSTAAETTDADTLDSFTSDGFQVDADVKVNTNTEKYVAWCWKESATSGFDIVSYTGNVTNRTISHNLSAVPKMIFTKNLPNSGGYRWNVYHASNTSAPETDVLVLNDGAATEDSALYWNDTAPTSSVFSLGTGGQANNDGEAYIAYLFADVQGFSKFGSYTGNGNVDGPFIYTGFRPAYFLSKKTSATNGWQIFDNKRNPTNTMGIAAFADSSEVEYNYSGDGTPIVDFVSNGFKLRGVASNLNASGASYVYMAFAEAPFANSNGVPCNAR